MSHNRLIYIRKTLEAKKEMVDFGSASVHQEPFTCSYVVEDIRDVWNVSLITKKTSESVLGRSA